MVTSFGKNSRKIVQVSSRYDIRNSCKADIALINNYRTCISYRFALQQQECGRDGFPWGQSVSCSLFFISSSLAFFYQLQLLSLMFSVDASLLILSVLKFYFSVVSGKIISKIRTHTPILIQYFSISLSVMFDSCNHVDYSLSGLLLNIN